MKATYNFEKIAKACLFFLKGSNRKRSFFARVRIIGTLVPFVLWVIPMYFL